MGSVDVIVPCYRYGHFLRECVESVLAQSLQNVRVLIIDDASPDNTAEVAADLARKDSRVTLLQHAENKGHIATYNEGIEWASGDYFLLLSADDYLVRDALRRATDFMDAHLEIGFTFGKAIDLIETGQQTQTSANSAVEVVVQDGKWSILTGEQFLSLLEANNSLNIVRSPTALIRTELQKRVGHYRPDLPHTGDLEMWLRLATHAPVGVLATYQAFYRLHGDNMQVAYYRAQHLPDLQQRKAAFDSLVESDPVSQSTRVLYRKLLLPLAHEAMQFANAAYTDGDEEIARQLCEFAVGLDPEIRRTIMCWKLRCKQCLGVALWHTVRSAIGRLRKAHNRASIADDESAAGAAERNPTLSDTSSPKFL